MRHKTITVPRAFAMLLLAAGATVSASEIYRWVDDEGVVHFSQWAPADETENVSTVQVESSTPADYDPQDDPYSILNQSERIHDLWSDLLAEKDTRQDADDRAVPAPSFPADDYYRPGFPFFAVHPGVFRNRTPPFAKRQQLRVLEEFDRSALPRAHSINSSVHRRRIEAKRQAIETVREQRRESRPPRRDH